MWEEARVHGDNHTVKSQKHHLINDVFIFDNLLNELSLTNKYTSCI